MLATGPFRLTIQVLVAVTALLVGFRIGLVDGSLAPLVRLDGLEALVVPIMAFFYLVAGGAFALIGMELSLVLGLFGRSEGGTGYETDTEGKGWERVTGPAITGTAAGSLVGGALVFGVPAWLSPTLPLVALLAAAVSFVFLGDAVSIRGVDTALWSAGGTIYLLVVPAALYPGLSLAGLFIAAVLGTTSFLGARRWVRGGLPVDRHVSAALALVLALVSGGVMAYDLSGPRPTVELDAEATVNLSAVEIRTYSYSDVGERRATVSVGTLTVRNEFDFARTADLPSYDACLYGEDGTELKTTFALPSVAAGDDWIRHEDEVRLAGRSRHRYPVFVLFEDRVSRVPTEIRELGTVPVRRADRCPDTTDGPALVLVPTDAN